MDGGGATPAPHYPSAYPTSSPSVTDFYYEERTLATQLHITEERAMDDLEQELYVGCVDVFFFFIPRRSDVSWRKSDLSVYLSFKDRMWINFAKGGTKPCNKYETIPSLSFLI
jgi:hypothetical protein